MNKKRVEGIVDEYNKVQDNSDTLNIFDDEWNKQNPGSRIARSDDYEMPIG